MLRELPSTIDAFLCAYSAHPLAQEAALEAVLGRLDTQGFLPVSIPALYKAGYGLSLETPGGLPTHAFVGSNK